MSMSSEINRLIVEGVFLASPKYLGF